MNAATGGLWVSLRRFQAKPARMGSIPTPTRSRARCVRTWVWSWAVRGSCCSALAGRGGPARLNLAPRGVSELFLVNRTRSKAEAVASEIRERGLSGNVVEGYPAGAVDLVLNATSVGLGPNDPVPFDERQFSLRRAAAVYDMIYRPAETALLKAANAAGCPA